MPAVVLNGDGAIPHTTREGDLDYDFRKNAINHLGNSDPGVGDVGVH